MEFRILGPLEVIEDGQALDLGGQKLRALLAMLVLHAGEVVSVDRLIEALWEDDPPDTAPKALQVYVSQLRKVIGRERLLTRTPGYVLRLESNEVDLARFEALRAEGRSGDALKLWRGPPLGEFAYQRFAQPEIARLQDLELACREDRIDAELAAGRHAEVVGELEWVVAEHPVRERFRGQLLLALYRSGRQAEALEAYHRARRALVDGLGIEPSRELRELHQAILNQDPALDLVPPALPAEKDPARAAFVGREAELAELLAGLDDAFAARGRLFLLVGEPGIGKSRLAEELIGYARRRGAQTLVGRCWEAGGAPAYWPWVQSLRGYVREAEPATLSRQLGSGVVDLAQLLPELRELFPGLGEPPQLEAESARFRLFEAVSAFLGGASDARPLVLMLDDLHAADEPSLLLLRFLARELAGRRMLVIGAYRNVDPTPSAPLTSTLAEVAREPVTRTIELSGLEPADVRGFIELVSGETPSDALVAALHEDTDGNPLFVGETVRLLATEGGLDNATPGRRAIPQSVRDVIARRVAHLSPECNRVLVLASVLGREFGLAVLSRVADVSEDRLLETLDEAMEERVVSDVPGAPGRLRFAHVLIRDTLYEGLTTARRVRLHRLVVKTLEAGPDADAAELAHHSIAGSDFDKGLQYARRAGDRALALLAWEEAVHLYETALDAFELSGQQDERVRCELLLSLGEAAGAGDRRASKVAFAAAAAIARRLVLPRQLALAAVGYGGRSMHARASGDAQLVPLLEEALSGLADEDELRPRLLARLAGALRDEPSRDRRAALSAEAVALARKAGNPSALAYALDGRHGAILGPDTAAECLALGTELLDVARGMGDLKMTVHGHLDRFIAEVTTGDMHRGKLDLDAMVRLVEELSLPTEFWQVYAAQTMVALAEGRLERAEELMSRWVAFGERAQPEMATSIYWLHRQMLAEFRGDFDEVESPLSELAEAYPARSFLRGVLAFVEARLGRNERARRALRELTADGIAALPFEAEWLYGMSLLADTCVVLGDGEAADTLYAALEPWGALNAVDHPEGMRGSVFRYLAKLAALLGRLDDAARHFEAAIEMNELMGARPWLAYTQHDYARLLAERDAPGDGARAKELLAEARATYRELGMREPEAATPARARR